MTETKEFRLEMSKGELLWLLQALGKLNVILPGEPFCSLTPTELNACLEQGRMTLTQRGLIHPRVGIAMEIDRFIVSFMEWLSAPEKLVLIQVLRPHAEPSTAGLYSRAQRSLLLEFAANYYRLLVFQEDEGLWSYCCGLCEIPLTIDPNPGQAFWLPEPIPLFRLFCRDPQAVRRALLARGLSSEEISLALDCLRGWKTLTQLTFFETKEQKLGSFGVRFLGSNGTHLWASSVEKTETEKFVFTPLLEHPKLDSIVQVKLSMIEESQPHSASP